MNPFNFKQAHGFACKSPCVELNLFAGEVQAAGSAAVELAGAAGASKKRKAVAAAKPVMVQPVERELAEFNAEMAELGEDVNTG